MVVVRDYAGEIKRADNGGEIIRVSSDPKRLHGYNPSDVICDELAQWTTPTLRAAWAALTTAAGRGSRHASSRSRRPAKPSRGMRGSSGR
jgi:hypothetical protein